MRMPVATQHSPLDLEYFLVDVFTETPLAGGNQLAVVLDTVGLSTERMQAIAREFNLSETTFVQRRTSEVEAAEGVRVRIFTTDQELAFAGHPTLGTSCVLAWRASETLRGETVTLALSVGAVPVRFDVQSNISGALFGEMRQRDPEFGVELDRVDVARLTGLASDDLDPGLPPQVVSTGNPFAVVVLHSVDALKRVRVEHEEATPWLRERGARWFYILAPTGDREPAWRARMQFNGKEDPATGSAAGPAIAYLVKREVVPSGERIHLRQGVEMGRTSDLYLTAKLSSGRVTDVRVAGSTVFVASGRLFVP
jgi:trans-2,3-dihydro-3-hydroxyanthranilate isomerase